MYGPFAMMHCHPGKKQVWIGHWRADNDTLAKCAERLADTYHGVAPMWDDVSQRIRMEVLDHVSTNVAHRYGIANPLDFCLAADSLREPKPFAVEPFTLCCSDTRRLVVWHIPSVKNTTYGVSFMPFSQEVFVGECLIVAYAIDPDDTLCTPTDLPISIMSKCTPVWHDDIRCNEEHTQDEFTQELLYWCFRAAEKCLADRFGPKDTPKDAPKDEEAATPNDTAPKAQNEEASKRSGKKEKAPKAPPKEEAAPQKVFVLELDDEDMQFLRELMEPEPKMEPKKEPDDVDTLVDYINRGGAPSKKKDPAHRKAVAKQQAKAERRRKARSIQLEDPTIRGIRNLLRK